MKHPEIDRLLTMGQDFFNSCAEAVLAHLLDARDIVKTDGLFEVCHNMLRALNQSTDSIFLLLGANRPWDASILLRSVIEGSAKFCYMLTAPSLEEEERRLNEFMYVLSKKELGSLEQPVARLLHGVCGRGDIRTCVGELKRIIDEQKVQSGESRQLAEISKKWKFWEVARVLRKECWIWSRMGDLWEYRYAMSNDLVHKTDSGCGEMVERADRNPEYRDVSDKAHDASLLLDACMLWYLRYSVLAKRVNGTEIRLDEVFMAHKPLFDTISEMERSFDKARRENETPSQEIEQERNHG